MLDDAPFLLPFALAAFLGGLSRWALSRVLPERVGTFAANAAAATVLGASLALPEPWQAAVGAGFAGALSTWSTLAKECGELVKRREWATLSKYTALTAAFGVAGAGFGMYWTGLLP